METISRFTLTFLLNAGWQVPLTVGAAALAAWSARNASARYRHILWVTALAACFLVPVSSLFRLDTRAGAGGGALIEGRISTSGSPTPLASGGTDVSPSVSQANRSSAASLFSRFGVSAFPVSIPTRLALVLSFCYWTFLLYRTSQLWRAWIRTKKILRSASVREFSASVERTIATCKAAMGLEHVAVLRSSCVGGPVTLGVRRPVVILPNNLVEDGPPEILTSALGHELAHVLRRDFLMNLLSEFVFLPVSFHPAATLAKRRIAETRELACDEVATNRLVESSAYARALVAMARSISTTFPRRGACYTLGVFDAQILEERIMTLIHRKSRFTATRGKVVLTTGVLALLFSTATVSMFSLAVEDPAKARSARNTPSKEAPEGGVQNGVTSGVINGVLGGVVDGVPGGISWNVQAQAQRGENKQSGTISGTVSDPSGAHVSGAFASILNEEVGLKQTTVTDLEGRFSFSGLPAGHYQLEVGKAGFLISRPEITLGPHAGTTGTLAIALEPARVLQAVDVTAKAPPSRGETPPKTPGRRIRVGGLVEATKLMSQKKPEYPESARAKGIDGIVLLEAVISKDGIPLDCRVLSSPDPELSRAAIDAVRQWRYEPTLLNGEPIEVVSEIAVRFHLER